MIWTHSYIEPSKSFLKREKKHYTLGIHSKESRGYIRNITSTGDGDSPYFRLTGNVILYKKGI